MKSESLVRKLIFDALHADPDRIEVGTLASMRQADWERLAAVVKMHRLGPMLYYRLDNKNPIPHEFLENLHGLYRRNTLRNMSMYRELGKVTRLLDSAGIPSIALKGAYLSSFAYPELGLRPLRDLDLLVSRDEAVRSFNLLKDQGYRPYSNGLPETFCVGTERHLTPLISDDGILIELHLRLIGSSERDIFSTFEEGMERSITRNFGTTPVRFLRQEDLLLHLCVHASLEHQLNIGPLILSDIAFLTKSHQIDWPDFIALVCKGGWQNSVIPLLYLAKAHTDANIPQEFIDKLGSIGEETLKSAEFLLFSDPIMLRDLSHDGVHELMYSSNLRKKFSALAGMIFPARDIVVKRFPVSADSVKAFLFYPAYWLRLLRTRLPQLLAALLSRNRELKQLASHQNEFKLWLQTSPERENQMP